MIINFCLQICNSSAKWYTVVRIPGREDFRLQTLVWATQKAHAGRLFGISLHGIIFEVGDNVETYQFRFKWPFAYSSE